MPPPTGEEQTPWRQLEARFLRFRDWFDGQDRRVKTSVMMIGFFFTINLLFGGIANPWFIFPSAPFFAYILLRRRRGDGGADDEDEPQPERRGKMKRGRRMARR